MTEHCLSDAENATIAAAREAYESIITIPCTVCDYYVPCPQDVKITEELKTSHEFLKGWTE